MPWIFFFSLSFSDFIGAQILIYEVIFDWQVGGPVGELKMTD